MSWTQERIRRTFLDYFVQHKQLSHRELGSSALIPRDDPTLLFANAGMNQFKSLLLGQEKRDYTRACSVQKCIRAGGKHNDLDAVGKDGRHCTFFEMLGNWSFGDYYKEDAIRMAWELSTQVYSLDPQRIYISIYKDDDESYRIWKEIIGVDPERIYRFGDIEKGDEENFWSMGKTGPCGPCTELFYDLGPEAGSGPDDVMGGEGDRFLEFWNNVFMEFNRDEEGKLSPLAIKSVDTGMGMERITLILQGKLSVYETDLFQPIIQEIITNSGASWEDPSQRIDIQVIADHLRSLTWAISEGALFSNEGRGYVLRRILRRAVRHGRRLGFEGPFLYELLPCVAELFEGIYELPAHILSNTIEAIREEEARFFRTIDRGMSRLQGLMKSKEEKLITGKEAFTLYDTFGFPVDLTRIEAEEFGFSVDEAGFQEEMEKQRRRAREGANLYEDGREWKVLRPGLERGFLDYGLERLETEILRWRPQGERVEVVLYETPFYAESGGELADRGSIQGEGFQIELEDVQRINNCIYHIGRLKGEILGATVVAHVDIDHRQQKRAHHTATHLLHAALKAVVDPRIAQKGSVVEPGRLRFDFSHSKPLNSKQLQAVETWANLRVRRNEVVEVLEGVPLEEAREQGVVALFGEKYGDQVRTVRSGADSFELCGGNHCARTGEIGQIMITTESGVAAGVRRIEAVVAQAAELRYREERALLYATAQRLKTEPARLLSRVEALQKELKESKRALEKLRSSGGTVDADALLAEAQQLEGIPLVVAEVKVDDRSTLSGLVDHLRDKSPGCAVLLAARLDGKIALIAGLGPELKRSRRVHAGKLIKALSERLGGRGGGRPDFAQGGGKDLEGLTEALNAVPQLLREQL